MRPGREEEDGGTTARQELRHEERDSGETQGRKRKETAELSKEAGVRRAFDPLHPVSKPIISPQSAAALLLPLVQ